MSVQSFSTLLSTNGTSDAPPPLAWTDEELHGRIAKSGGERQSAASKISKGLDARLGTRRRFGMREGKVSSGGSGFDSRQRAVVKIHFFGHGNGGGAALGAHMRYVARDAAQREPELEPEREPTRHHAETEFKAHTDYLTRDGAGPVFYDALDDQVDGRARALVRAQEDKRHFRIIVSAEEGERLKDLKPFVRDAMERTEHSLGTGMDRSGPLGH